VITTVHLLKAVLSIGGDVVVLESSEVPEENGEAFHIQRKSWRERGFFTLPFIKYYLNTYFLSEYLLVTSGDEDANHTR
jgi:hypothetical protein